MGEHASKHNISLGITLLSSLLTRLQREHAGISTDDMAVDMTAGTDVACEVDVADETWRIGSDVAVVMACLVRADMAVVAGVIDDVARVN